MAATHHNVASDFKNELNERANPSEQQIDPKQPRSYVLEQLEEINREFGSDDENEFEYDEIPMEDLAISDSDSEAGEETLEKAILKLQQKHFISQGESKGNDEDSERENNGPEVIRKQELLDDFIRNFLIQKKLFKSLESFQNEWYEKIQTGQISADEVGTVPDVYQHNSNLEKSLQVLTEECLLYKKIASQVKATYNKLRKERDYHKLHHRRVSQEKVKLSADYKKVCKQLEHVQPTLKHWQQKYELLMKEKTMISLERDRLQEITAQNTKFTNSINNEVKAAGSIKAAPPVMSDLRQQGARINAMGKKVKSIGRDSNAGNTIFSSDERPNPFAGDPEKLSTAVGKSTVFKQVSSLKAHSMAVSALKFQGQQKNLLSVSDDRTWKLWNLNNNELISSGTGHKDWIGDGDFHPKENLIATASGDGTVRLWNSQSGQCVKVFNEHLKAVWTCAFHDSGDFFASGSLDQTAKLFDIRSGRSRMTLRGHADSINHLFFQPYTNQLWTCSGDKTISHWDLRSGLCVQTFYGHMNAVVHGAFNHLGTDLVTCDLDGIVKVWDIRNTQEKSSFNFGPAAANKISLDPRGTCVSVALSNGECPIYELYTGELLNTLRSNQDCLQSVSFDFRSELLVTGGSDGSINIWN